MAKGSGNTRTSSSRTPSATSLNTPGMSASDADTALRSIGKMRAPAMNSTNEIELPGGYRAQIRHMKAGYGSGGLLESDIIDPSGNKVGGVANHRERYGSNGYATFASKSEALNDVRDAMQSYIRIKFKGERY